MPIKGITDKGMGFPQIGKIRKGAPKKQGERMKDLKYFRVEFDERETEAAEKFVSAHGDEPQEIDIVLPFDDIDRCWSAYLEAYTASQMVAMSDGEKYIFLRDLENDRVIVRNGVHVDTGEIVPYKKDEACAHYEDAKGKKQPLFCKPSGRLKVIVPALGRLAYLTLYTTSVHDIGEIQENLEALKFVNGGKLQGVDIILKRRPKKVSVPKPSGGRMRVEKWLINIEASPDWVAKQVNGTRKRAELTPGIDEPENEYLSEFEDFETEVIDAETADDEPKKLPEGDRKLSMKQQGWAIDIIGDEAEAIKALDASILDEKSTQKEISRFAYGYVNTDGDFETKVSAGNKAVKAKS